MNLYSLLTALLCFSASSAFATVTGVSYGADTASRIEAVAGTGSTETAPVTNYVITAGYAGAEGECANPDTANNTVCNSCTGLGTLTSGNTRCAQRSIYPGLKLAITVTLDKAVTNPQILVLWGTTPVATDSASSITGASFTVYIPWSNICNAASSSGLGPNCASTSETEAIGDLYVGLSDGSATAHASGAVQKFRVRIRSVTSTASLVTPDHEEPISDPSFTDFMVLPGDAKVYLSDIWRGDVSPTSGSEIKWQALRLFYEVDDGTHDFTDITYNGDNWADFDVEKKDTIDTPLDSGRLTGLENETEYMFNIASVDEATIVSGFLDPVALSNSTNQGERYRAIPGEVVGLLSNKECFIATAAYGSQMDAHVELLRKFRSQILGSTQWGRNFIRFYYQHSPPIAKFIAKNETLRTAVRWSLWPVIFFADVSLKLGVWFTLAALLAALGSVSFVVIRMRRQA